MTRLLRKYVPAGLVGGVMATYMRHLHIGVRDQFALFALILLYVYACAWGGASQ